MFSNASRVLSQCHEYTAHASLTTLKVLSLSNAVAPALRWLVKDISFQEKQVEVLDLTTKMTGMK